MDIPESKVLKKDISRLRMVIKNDYGPEKQFNIYEYKNGVYRLPLHWAVKNLHVTPEFKQPDKANVGRFLAILRPVQINCMEMCKKELEKSYGGGIINLTTGSGKSITAMAIFNEVKLKTLVVVHTTELLQQWKKSIQQFLPDVKIGTIQGKTFDTDNKDIVVGMLQTISMKSSLNSDLFTKFGLVIYDEVQFLSAEVFSKTLLKTRAKYTFGLSATVERKDGMEVVFKYHIGDIIYSNASTSRKQYTEIKKVFYNNPELKERSLYSGNPNISLMINDLADDTRRSDMIVEEIMNLNNDRQVLVLSERVSHLKYLQKKVGDELSGLFIGSSKQEEKLASKKKRILFATYQIASVGFDHPKLNTLVLATPRSSITQAVGRIYRKIHEINPMIIDIVDTYSIFPYQYKKRDKIYKTLCEEKQEECMFE